MPTDLPSLINSYRNYLAHHEALNPKQHALARFDQRLQACPEAANAEAVAFAFLRSRSLDPRLFEDASGGGLTSNVIQGASRSQLK